MAKSSEKIEPQEKVSLNINTGTVIGGQYAHAVSLNRNDTEAVLEFVFIKPNPSTPTEVNGDVVARIVMANNNLRLLSDALSKVFSDDTDKVEATK